MRFKQNSISIRNGRRDKFQFHSGAIQTELIHKALDEPNPISIPLWCDSNQGAGSRRRAARGDFNSTLVRFKPVCRQRCGLARAHFNSTLVRFKHGKQTTGWLVSVFQFHSGAIQTGVSTQYIGQIESFQFHSGAIQTNAGRQAIHAASIFQFHSGAIQTQTCNATSLPLL